MTMWTIRADYDQETACWWVLDSDVPGLAADAATLERLADKIGTMLPDLLAIHADQLVDEKRRIGPHKLRIIAHHEHMFDVAA